MIPFDVLTVFVVASVALALAPGPDNIFVLTQSALYGRLSGLFVTFGLCTGLVFHTSAVAIGVAAVFQASAIAFTVLKSIGAAYLLYLAFQAFRAGASSLSSGNEQTLSLGHLYRRGIIMNVTNPKVAIFFLAFLPQFADPARGSLSIQIFVLGAVFMISAMIVFSAVAWGAGFLGDVLRRSEWAQKLLNWLAGFVFAGLAARLLLAER